MNNRSKVRGRPGPDAINIKHIVNELEKALHVEDKYMNNLLINDQKYGDDALRARDGAVRKLRFLKIWFELPSQVFLTCVNLLDRFLTKMRVKPTHLGCVAISCLYVAADLHKCAVEAEKLVTISEVKKCKVSDLERMSDIVREKLGLLTGDPPLTAFNYLNHYLQVLECAATQLNVKSQVSTMMQKKDLLTRTEVVMLDSQCASMRPSVVALALIQSELERFLAAEIPAKSPYYSVEMYQWLTVIYELQIICTMIPKQFAACYAKVKNMIQNYDSNVRTCALSRIKWRFSTRMNSLKPSENFCATLCVIQE